jgi:tRNA threonylcarbamoyladenosine biosynthesis protein TsaE
MTRRRVLELAGLGEREVAALAHAVASVIEVGTVYSLEGELGSGKTFFVRKLAEALGIRQHVTSPTFVLQKTYTVAEGGQGVATIVHYDVYRLESWDELLEIGFEELAPDAVAFVEWGDRFADELPAQAWRVRFSIADETHRNVRIEAPAPAIERLEAALRRQPAINARSVRE